MRLHCKRYVVQEMRKHLIPNYLINKNKMKKTKFLAIYFMATVCSLGLAACSNDDDEDGNSLGIPSDELAEDNPTISSTTTYVPNPSYTVELIGNDAVVTLDMTGVQDVATYDWLRLIGTANSGQNIWISVDGQPKGITVTNNADEDANKKKAADLVFLVDNSGSMGEEADAIARDIISWSKTLEASNLDMRFACVGYDGLINGAINLTDADSLSKYLNRHTGIGRTMGFYGTDKNALSNAASPYDLYSQYECGGAALRYADANISFRTGSNRIYVNFTDEPNQPRNISDYSVEYFKDQSNWEAGRGTVHTVFSADSTYYWETLYSERPWRISEYTGGTVIFAPSDFSGVTLESLPVTGAMQNSYTIRFTNVKEFMDGQQHEVKITILSTDGKTRAEKIFYIVFDTSSNL